MDAIVPRGLVWRGAFCHAVMNPPVSVLVSAAP